MICIDWSKVSQGEKLAVEKIQGTRECPICPACGHDMDLCINEIHGRYLSNYLCKNCRNWLTTTCESKSIQLSAEDAYKKALSIHNDVRRFFLNERRTVAQ